MQIAAPTTATATTPLFVTEAIMQLDWLHEVVGMIENESPEQLDPQELALGVGYARTAAELLESGGPADGFDLTGATQAIHGAERLVAIAHDLLVRASDQPQVGDRLMDLGSKADVLVHDAYRALGTDRG